MTVNDFEPTFSIPIKNFGIMQKFHSDC
jgi:hypothetical protein